MNYEKPKRSGNVIGTAAAFRYIRGMDRSVLKSYKKELFLCVDLILVQETIAAGLSFSSLSFIAAAETMITAVTTIAATTITTAAAIIITITAATATVTVTAAAHQCAEMHKTTPRGKSLGAFTLNYSAYFVIAITMSAYLQETVLRSKRPKFSPCPKNALLSHHTQVMPLALAVPT